MNPSKYPRLNRLFRSSGNCLDVAIDHGVFNEYSFLDGLRDMPSGGMVQLDPVRIIPERVRAPSAFEVRTSGGMTLSVPAGFDEFELRRLLDVLAGC